MAAIGGVLWLVWSCAGEDETQSFHRNLLEVDTGATSIRDAAIRGDLHAARALAGKMVERMPAAATSPEPGRVEDLRLTLSDIRGAATPRDAAIGVGKLTAVCAGCHAEAKATLPPPVPRQAAPDAPAVRAEMSRHAAAIDGLWSGIVGNQEQTLLAALDALDHGGLSPGDHVPWHTVALDRAAHETAAKLRASPPEQRPAALGELLAACSDCHLAGNKPAMPRIAGIALPDLSTAMNDHFLDALELQLAVMGGDLAAAKAAGQKLSAATDPPPPGVAAAYLGEVRNAASRVTAATSVLEAAKAAADLQLACSKCHVASGGGPTEVVPEPPKEPHLAVHLYGAFWMGYGLLAPDERAWMAASAALGSAALTPEGWKPEPGTEPLDAPIHTLAQRAALTTEPADRAAIYAELMASCAPCHQQLARKP